MSTSPNHPTLADPQNAQLKRRKLLFNITVVLIFFGLFIGGYEWFENGRAETTDNAYVQGNIVQITPQVGGTVMAVMVEDTDHVKAGQTLIKLDPADSDIALQQASANLAQTVRQVRTLFVNNDHLAAQVALREAEVQKAQSELKRAKDDLARRQSLDTLGAVSGEEMSHTKTQFNNAQSALASIQAALVSAKEQLNSNHALTDGARLETHPYVEAAAAKLREAYLARQRVELPAPVDGYIARRSVQLGQRVSAGTPLMAVIPLKEVWVDANFKEVQLRNMRIGQTAKLSADLYGKKVEYDGTVQGLGIGTGAAFALLPAQNATGNWIKVVQRVPVRIALNPEQLVKNPLRIGLSMVVEVDTTQKDGKSLADAPRPEAASATTAYQIDQHLIDDKIAHIIATNASEVRSKPAIKHTR